MNSGLILQLLACIIQITAAIAFSAGSLFIGMNALDRMGAGLDGWAELKKGNLAAGLFYAAGLMSMALLVWPRIDDVAMFIDPSLPLLGLAATLVNLALSLAISVALLYVTVQIVNCLAPGTNGLNELRRGNLAVSLVFSISMLLVVYAAAPQVEGLFNLIKSAEMSLV